MAKKIKKVKKGPSLPSIGSEVTYIGIFGDKEKAVVVAHSNEFKYPLDNTILIRFEDGREKWTKISRLDIN